LKLNLIQSIITIAMMKLTSCLTRTFSTKIKGAIIGIDLGTTNSCVAIM